MTALPQLPDFDAVNQSLKQAHARTDAAEAHGLVCGIICAGNRMNGKSWLEVILGTGDSKNEHYSENRSLLLSLYQVSSQKLQAMDFEFQLLLPNDDGELQSRAEALSNWCQGFLVALDMAGINIREGVSIESKEILQHFFEISRLDYETIDVAQEDEWAYYEVMEYVRMAVLMIYNEIAVNREGLSEQGKIQLH